MSNKTSPKVQDQTLPSGGDVQRIITAALAEDIGSGDITSQLLIPETSRAQMQFVAREGLVVCGTFIPAEVYKQLNPAIAIEVLVEEGELVANGTALLTMFGPARDLLTGERVALNLMQRMCGIATLTHVYVDAVSGTNAVILDTRKTMPGLRQLDKYAVRTGGGKNHRMGLYDMVLIKDNHIALFGSISDAIGQARSASDVPIVVECDTLEQVAAAIDANPDRILLDNMDIETLHEAVMFTAGRVPLEASGGVSLDTVRRIAETGVDFISVGKLTHSAPGADIGADVTLSP